MRSFIPMPHKGGMVAAMFTHRLRPHSVFKVVDPERDSYFAFAEWCHSTKAHLQDPHFPHIRGISRVPPQGKIENLRILWTGKTHSYPVQVLPHFRLIEVERLHPVHNLDHLDCSNAWSVMHGFKEPDTLLGYAAHKLSLALPHLQSHLDLHPGNFMQRANGQLVIIDPYSCG